MNTIEKVRQLRARGWSLPRIAAHCGVSQKTVEVYSWRLLQAGRTRRRVSGRKPDPAIAKRNARIARLWARGLEALEIAQQCNVPRSTVYQVVRDLRDAGRL